MYLNVRSLSSAQTNNKERQIKLSLKEVLRIFKRTFITSQYARDSLMCIIECYTSLLYRQEQINLRDTQNYHCHFSFFFQIVRKILS
jgi:hypothetical protein